MEISFAATTLVFPARILGITFVFRYSFITTLATSVDFCVFFKIYPTLRLHFVHVFVLVYFSFVSGYSVYSLDDT